MVNYSLISHPLRKSGRTSLLASRLLEISPLTLSHSNLPSKRTAKAPLSLIDSKLKAQRKRDDARRPGRRRTPEIVVNLGAAGIELNGGVQRAELSVVARIVSLSAEFENLLLVQADIICAVTGASNLHIYAAIRGETPEDFLETRNAPGAFYSVTAKPKAE
jgi:hypothetical protein